MNPAGKLGWNVLINKVYTNRILKSLYDLVDFVSSVATQTNLVSFTYGVASLQLATPGAAALGVGSVVFLHGEDGGCLGNRWCSLVEGRGWHQSRGETLTGNIHRLRLLLQSAGHK